MDVSAVDVVGYIASALVLSSFLFKDVKKLRMMNVLGCAIFIAYGVLLDNSIPIIATNGAIIIINLYFLVKK